MAVKVLNEYERAVIFVSAGSIDHKGPGIIILLPFIDRMVRVGLRTVALDVPHQDVITRDNVSVQVVRSFTSGCWIPPKLLSTFRITFMRLLSLRRLP
jgi:hypothetical protein